MRWAFIAVALWAAALTAALALRVATRNAQLRAIQGA